MREGLLCVTSRTLEIHPAAHIRPDGAPCDGVPEDTLANQKGIDLNPVNGILTVSTGIYVVTLLLLSRSNRTYQVQNGPVLQGYMRTGPGEYVLSETSTKCNQKIPIEAITFDGGGISFKGAELPAGNIRFTNNPVGNVVNGSPHWPLRRGLCILSGIDLSTFADDADAAHADGFAISGRRVDQTSRCPAISARAPANTPEASASRA